MNTVLSQNIFAKLIEFLTSSCVNEDLHISRFPPETVVIYCYVCYYLWKLQMDIPRMIDAAERYLCTGIPLEFITFLWNLHNTITIFQMTTYIFYVVLTKGYLWRFVVKYYIWVTFINKQNFAQILLFLISK